jgi:hypothetical protein
METVSKKYFVLPWRQFFKTRVGAYAQSWRLRSKLAPTGELMQQWRGSAALRRRQLFRRRENLFKKLASGGVVYYTRDQFFITVFHAYKKIFEPTGKVCT